MNFYKNIGLAYTLLILVSSCKDKQDVKPQVSIPTVTTMAMTSITSNSAKSGGKVIYEGNGSIIQKGICWSLNQFATIEGSKTTNGSGAGDFSSSITGLFRGTTYYVRAYATDANGTVYGNEIKFSTSNLDIIDNNGVRLYIHPTDNATLSWGPSGLLTGANNTTNGSINTSITSSLTGNYAAKVCADLVAYEYSDWYLPSKDELHLMYQNRNTLSMTPGVYWSSTEVTDNEASVQNMQSGFQYDNIPKTTSNICRCVRKQ